MCVSAKIFLRQRFIEAFYIITKASHLVFVHMECTMCILCSYPHSPLSPRSNNLLKRNIWVRNVVVELIEELTKLKTFLLISFSFYFILSYFNTKPYQLKKKRETIQMSIYIYIKSFNFAGLPRDRASGRMLIL